MCWSMSRSVEEILKAAPNFDVTGRCCSYTIYGTASILILAAICCLTHQTLYFVEPNNHSLLAASRIDNEVRDE